MLGRGLGHAGCANQGIREFFTPVLFGQPPRRRADHRKTLQRRQPVLELGQGSNGHQALPTRHDTRTTREAHRRLIRIDRRGRHRQSPGQLHLLEARPRPRIEHPRDHRPLVEHSGQRARPPWDKSKQHRASHLAIDSERAAVQLDDLAVIKQHPQVLHIGLPRVCHGVSATRPRTSCLCGFATTTVTLLPRGRRLLEAWQGELPMPLE